MNPLEMAYLPLVALLNLAIIYYWQVKVGKKIIAGKQDWIMLLSASFLNTWGLDTLHRLSPTDSLMDVFKISLGVWILFTAATSYKYYRFRSLPFKQFWLDYGGDLISYMFIGVGIYVCT